MGTLTYEKLKSEKQNQVEGANFNKQWVRIYDNLLIDDDEAESFDSLDIFQNGEIKRVGMEKLTEKEIYTTLIRKHFKKPHRSEITWQFFFQNNLSFPQVWGNFNNKFVMEDTRTYIWEQIHLSFFNTAWFNKISDKNDRCPLCKEIPQTSKHIILYCNVIKYLWEKIEPFLKKLTPAEVNEKEMVFGIINNKLKIEEQLRNWFTYKLREIVGKCERTFHNTPKNINFYSLITKKFKAQIQKEIIYNFHVYKKNKKEFLFFKNYNCKVNLVENNNGKLKINIGEILGE